MHNLQLQRRLKGPGKEPAPANRNNAVSLPNDAGRTRDDLHRLRLSDGFLENQQLDGSRLQLPAIRMGLLDSCSSGIFLAHDLSQRLEED